MASEGITGSGEEKETIDKKSKRGLWETRLFGSKVGEIKKEGGEQKKARNRLRRRRSSCV